MDSYTYHTTLDTVSNVAKGVIQDLGDNLLCLTRHFLSGKVDLSKPETIIDDDEIVYFDIIGRLLITYKQTTSTIIEIVLISLVTIVGLSMIIIDHIWNGKQKVNKNMSSIYVYFKRPLLLRILLILIFFLCYLLSIIFGCLLTSLFAAFMAKVRSFRWYGSSLVASAMYIVPFLIGALLGELLWKEVRRRLFSHFPKQNLMDSTVIDHIEHFCLNFERHWSILLVFVSLMIIHISCSIPSLYMILLWSIFMCPIYLIFITVDFVLHWTRRKSLNIFNEPSWFWLFIPYFVSIVPFSHTLELSNRGVRTFIPMSARLNEDFHISSDLIVAALVVAPIVPLFLIFLPNIQRTMKIPRVLVILSTVFVLTTVAVCFRSPFSSSHPQIVLLRHKAETDFEASSYDLTNVKKSHSLLSLTLKSPFPVKTLIEKYKTENNIERVDENCDSRLECTFGIPVNDSSMNVDFSFDPKSSLLKIRVKHPLSRFIELTPIYPIDLKFEPGNHLRSETTIFSSSMKTRFRLHVSHCDLNSTSSLRFFTAKDADFAVCGSTACKSLHEVINVSIR